MEKLVSEIIKLFRVIDPSSVKVSENEEMIRFEAFANLLKEGDIVPEKINGQYFICTKAKQTRELATQQYHIRKAFTGDYKQELNSLHNKAMELADEADHLKRQKKDGEAQQKFLSAHFLEAACADYLNKCGLPTEEIEPSRMVINLGAGWLAFSAGLYDAAHQYGTFAKQYGNNEADTLLNDVERKVIENELDGRWTIMACSLSISPDCKRIKFTTYSGNFDKNEVTAVNKKLYRVTHVIDATSDAERDEGLSYDKVEMELEEK